MKIPLILFLTFIASIPVPAQEKGTDSKSEQASGMTIQYELFTADGPVHAFAVCGDVIWCATESNVMAIPMHTGSKTPYITLGTMPASGICAITADKQGRIWFGGRNGVAVKAGPGFTVYNRDNGLPGSAVLSICASDDGTVWVGTDSGLGQYRNETWKLFFSPDGLPSNRIQAVMSDDKGTLWVGTDKGIAVRTATGWTCYTMKNGLSWNDTKALAWDPHKGMLWAAVGDKDVNAFDGQKWSVYMDIQQGISTIMVDSQSRVWFGTEKGVWKFNGDDWVNEMAPFGIPMKRVYQMRCEDKGNLWFATERGVAFLPDPYPF